MALLGNWLSGWGRILVQTLGAFQWVTEMPVG